MMSKLVQKGDKLKYDSIKAGIVLGVCTLANEKSLIFEVTSKNKGHYGYPLGATIQISQGNPWLSRRN